MQSFTIKDLENLSGIKAHTIRIWEQRYKFLKPSRTDTNIRFYSSDELKTLLDIALLNKHGFKVSHINRLTPDEINDRIASLDEDRVGNERMVNELVKRMIDLDMESFEQLLSEFIATKGIERLVLQIIFPFVDKIGILWQTGHISTVQEHLVSNILRQKLVVGIETIVSPTVLNKSFLLFLPEGQQHELGLLFVYFILKSKGASTIYLGSNVPLVDIEKVVLLKKPDVAFTHLVRTATTFNFDRFLQGVHQRLKGVKTIISGPLTQQHRKKPPPGIEFQKTLGEVMDYLSSLGAAAG